MENGVVRMCRWSDIIWWRQQTEMPSANVIHGPNWSKMYGVRPYGIRQQHNTKPIIKFLSVICDYYYSMKCKLIKVSCVVWCDRHLIQLENTQINANTTVSVVRGPYDVLISIKFAAKCSHNALIKLSPTGIYRVPYNAVQNKVRWARCTRVTKFDFFVLPSVNGKNLYLMPSIKIKIMRFQPDHFVPSHLMVRQSVYGHRLSARLRACVYFCFGFLLFFLCVSLSHQISPQKCIIQ